MSKSIDDPVAQRAIEWMVYLRSGEATAADWHSFARWRQSHPLHDKACASIERVTGQFEPISEIISSDSARRVLLTPSSRRRMLRGSIGLLAAGGLTLLGINQIFPVSALTSQYVTATGERRSVRLEDGSELHLNARTDIDIEFSDSMRQVTLHNGNILASVRHAERPFRINTRMGEVLLLEGRVNLRYENQGVHVAVLDNVAKIITRSGLSALVEAVHGRWFDGDHLQSIGIYPAAEAAWLQGRLEVFDHSLSYLINQFKSQSLAVIRLDDKVADLRVSGNFPLDDLPYTLNALAQTMPIRITQTTPYWISISARRNS